jgi:hypothetical protein
MYAQPQEGFMIYHDLPRDKTTIMIHHDLPRDKHNHHDPP